MNILLIISVILLILLVVGQFINNYKSSKVFDQLNFLVDNFLERTQEISVIQDKSIGKIKDLNNSNTEQLKEISVVNRHVDAIEASIKNLNEVNRLNKDSFNNLSVIKDISRNLSVLSNNIKLLDNVFKNIKERNKNAN